MIEPRMSLAPSRYYKNNSCLRKISLSYSTERRIKIASNSSATAAIALPQSEHPGTDLIEASTGAIASISGGSYDINALAYTSGGYEYRKHPMGSMTLVGINRQGDTKNTIYIKDWQAGQFGISLSRQEDNPERPRISHNQITINSIAFCSCFIRARSRKCLKNRAKLTWRESNAKSAYTLHEICARRYKK